MIINKKYFSFAFIAIIGLQSNTFARERYLRTEAFLAGINLSLGAMANHLDFDDSNSQENIKRIEVARSLIRTMLDGLKINNHDDFATGLPWLIVDGVMSTAMIANYSSPLEKKSTFKYYGACDAIEAAALIYASYIQPLDTDLATNENRTAQIDAFLASQVNSLARLINSDSPSKFLITLNVLYIIIILISRQVALNSNNNTPLPAGTTMGNLAQIQLEQLKANLWQPLEEPQQPQLALVRPITTNSMQPTQDTTINYDRNNNQITITSRNANGTQRVRHITNETTIQANDLIPQDNAPIDEVFGRSHFVVMPCCGNALEASSLGRRNNTQYHGYADDRNNNSCHICRAERNYDNEHYFYFEQNPQTGHIPAYQYTNELERRFQEQNQAIRRTTINNS